MAENFGKVPLDICKLALADIGTRSTISSVFPPDGSTEANLCNLYYNSIMLQLLRAANWNFATKTDLLYLWKALPGTPENQTLATVSGWSNLYPAPRWTYSYVYPFDCVRAHKLIGQPQQVPIAPPIFSGTTGTNPPISQRLPFARFQVASDVYDAAGNIMLGLSGYTTVVNGGSGYVVGDQITLAGGTLSLGSSIYAPQVGQAASVGVTALVPNSAGVVQSVEATSRGKYTVAATGNQQSTTGVGTGLVVGPTWASVSQPVILTHQEFPLLEYTYWGQPEPIMDESFNQAFIAALAGRLAQSLTGDKALANAKYAIANEHIINARVADGNEGLTVDDHMPDWLITRGAGGGLGYEMFFYPLGPLFPLAPLI